MLQALVWGVLILMEQGRVAAVVICSTVGALKVLMVLWNDLGRHRALCAWYCRRVWWSR